MTDCLFIPSNADRLVQPHRPKSLVRSDPASRAKGAIRQPPGLILGQTLLRNAETATSILHNNATAEDTGPTESALSP